MDTAICDVTRRFGRGGKATRVKVMLKMFRLPCRVAIEDSERKELVLRFIKY